MTLTKKKLAIRVELKARYLHYLLKKNENQCFSWVGLLVLLFLSGLLAALALPSISNRLNNSPQPVAKNNIDAMSRAQQAYFLEYQTFANSIEQLGVAIKPETENYCYQIHLGIKTEKNRYQFVYLDNIKGQNSRFLRLNKHVFPPPVFKSDEVVMLVAQPKKLGLKTYIGLVLRCMDESTGGFDCNHESLMFSSLFESEYLFVAPPRTLTVSLPLDFCSSPGCLQEAIPTPNGFRPLSNS